MKPKHSNTIGLAAILFLTFAITAFNFENPSFSENTKAYIFFIAGIITLIIWAITGRKSKR